MLKITPPNYLYCPKCATELDEQDSVAKFSKCCPKCGWAYYPHVACAAGAVIFNENKVLLVKRKNEPYKNTWMFPAGFVDFGESPEETVVREVNEETGLRINGLHLIDVLQNPDDPRAVGHFGFFYKVDSYEGKLKTDANEVSDIGWFEIDNLPKIGWKSHQKVAKIIAENHSRLYN